ncbi:MFS transporter [Mammaliicoccus fleurettii]|uniref:MFS transporter n=1 Tax=Mammaliicoccus fleurettii TaxID=150056 RepID=UPI000E034FF8|nr:MFS transporter [Mammaliicoccus fleurettii]RTX88971.1 MFS transporter [Mammaliicoccus fleurettii]SUM36180.1 quinolone resistance protein NorA [Mammaliicoccus fleurettii]HCN60085.1 MFS transporter [Staphylococcus sp.]
MKNSSFKKLFIILSIIVAISGFSQGMLLPLISVIFERNGISSSVNGIHATSLYIGVFLSSFFIEGLVRKSGFKYMILIGGAIVALSLLLFPTLKTLSIWFILRLLIGVGDNMLHFSTQTWLTHMTPKHKLGRTISVYGFSFSAGFMLGPLLAKLVDVSEALPFILSAMLSIITILLVLLIHNEFPSSNVRPISMINTLKNFGDVIKTSWIAFMFPLLYGLFEAGLHSNFPVYGLRNGLDVTSITLILPAFSLGAILFQVPLGMFSDIHGRKKVLLCLTLIGSIIFLLGDFLPNTTFIMMGLFLIAGLFTGSFYGLGVSYMTDLTPKHNLPAGNLMIAMSFSIGSMIGPILGGTIIQISNGTIFFTMIAVFVFIVFILLLVHRTPQQIE